MLQNLQSNPQNASSFYLARIYQLTPGSNASSIPLPDDPATFKPPTSAIFVSTLWSFSLVISLTCALLATLLQQWARRYLHVTLKWSDPQKHAQTRELMCQALKKQVPLRWMVEFLPFLLHTSVFLFLVGFVVYLFTFNSLVAGLVAGCAGTSLILYLYISLAPICSRDSPYSTPLTTLVWFITMGIISLFIRIRHFASRRVHLEDAEHFQHLRRLQESFQLYYQRMLKGITKDVEKLATTPSGLATFVLLSTFDFLDGVSDIEQFLSYIPGFYVSASAQEHFHEATFEDFNSDQLPSKISFFMEHVLSSDLLSDDEKKNHIAMCSKAINANTSLLRSTFKLTLQTPDSKIFGYPDFVNLALEQSHRPDADPWMKDYAQGVLAIAINRTLLDDNTWIDIAGRYLKPQHAQYSQNRHNLRLCNLIYLTRRLKASRLATSDQFAPGKDWHNALVEAQKVDVSGIAAELRNEFLGLWDELANVAHDARRDPNDQMRRNATSVLSLLDTVNTNLRAHP